MISPITITLDNRKKLKKTLEELNFQVLVGIPEDSPNNERYDSDQTNSYIGFIQEYGAPAANIPATVDAALTERITMLVMSNQSEA